MSIMMVIIMSIVRVMMPRLSFYLGEGNKLEYENLLNKTFPYIYLLVFPISVGIGILSKEIALFFGGIEYIVAQGIIIVFGIRLIVTTIETILINQVIFLNQRERAIIFIYIIGGAINFILKVILIKLYILVGTTAIFTTMISEIALIGIEYYYIKKYLDIKLEIFKLNNLKYLIFSLSFIPIRYILKDLNYNVMLNSLIVFIACSSIYFILLFITKDKCLIEVMSKVDIKKYISRRK